MPTLGVLNWEVTCSSIEGSACFQMLLTIRDVRNPQWNPWRYPHTNFGNRLDWKEACRWQILGKGRRLKWTEDQKRGGDLQITFKLQLPGGRIFPLNLFFKVMVGDLLHINILPTYNDLKYRGYPTLKVVIVPFSLIEYLPHFSIQDTLPKFKLIPGKWTHFVNSIPQAPSPPHSCAIS